MRLSATALLLSLILPAAAGAAGRPGAGGALDAFAPDGTRRGGCPLEHTDVAVDVAGFVARVAVTQVFRNPFPDPIEALYTFPLSDRGAVDAMTMKTGDRVIQADIERREDARRRYEAARDAGKLASLLDQERPNVFTQTLANLMPGATVEIHVEYVEPLAYRDGTFELIVPTVVGPRFVPPAGVPDGDRVIPPITPEGTRAGHDIAIAVDVDAGVPIGDVTAPLHAIDVERPAPERARVRLRQADEIPNRDFVLRWTVAGDSIRSTALVHRPASGGDGYVSVVLLPPRRVSAGSAAPKEMLFVIDRSGSQAGAPLEKAKETMRWILDHLNPDDTFQVIDFGSTSRQLFPAPRPATADSRRRARAYIDALQADGGTMMADAVRRACATPANAHRLRVVTFMTDGYVGNDLEVLDLVQRMRGTSRWFPFGTGNGVNRFLIDGMARLGGGEPYYALLGEPGDSVARTFYDHVSSPVLTDVHVEWRDLDVVDTHPDAPADVWAEKPLVIHARYRRAGSGRIVLTGFQHGEPYRQELAVTLPEQEPDHAAIASMWARAKVEALTTQDLGALQSGTFPGPLREQIVSVALAHRIVTPFTSFVAVEERVVNEGGTPRTVRVPVEMPDGVRYEGIFGAGNARDEAAAPAGGAVPKFLALRSAGTQPATLAPPEPARDRMPAPSPLGRSRLAPGLLLLLDRGAAAPGATACIDGWVSVEIELADASSAAVRDLERAGLVIESVHGRRVRGVVALDHLAALADLPIVTRVEGRADGAVSGGGSGTRGGTRDPSAVAREPPRRAIENRSALCGRSPEGSRRLRRREGRVVPPLRRRQVEHVAPGAGQVSSVFVETRSAVEPYRLANCTASIFDAIWHAGKRRERGTHLALHLETKDVTTCRRAAEEGVALRNGERTSSDNDRTWNGQALEIAHPNALPAIAGGKAGGLVTATDGEGRRSKVPIADDQVVHDKTCNGE